MPVTQRAKAKASSLMAATTSSAAKSGAKASTPEAMLELDATSKPSGGAKAANVATLIPSVAADPPTDTDPPLASSKPFASTKSSAGNEVLARVAVKVPTTATITTSGSTEPIPIAVPITTVGAEVVNVTDTATETLAGAVATTVASKPHSVDANALPTSAVNESSAATIGHGFPLKAGTKVNIKATDTDTNAPSAAAPSTGPTSNALSPTAGAKPVQKPGFQPAPETPLGSHIQAFISTTTPAAAAEVHGIDASIEAPVNAKPSFGARVAAHVASAVGSSLISVDAFGTPNVEANLESPTDAPASTADAKPYVLARVASQAASTVGTSLSAVHDLPVAINRDVLAVNSFETATDALAAEALDATEGAFPSVADAIEAANFGSSSDANIEDADDIQTCGKPGFQILPEAPLGTHTQASTPVPSLDNSEAGLESVTPSGFASSVSTAKTIERKPGFQTASKAPLSVHIQAPGTTNPSTVTPSGIDSNASSTADSNVKGTGFAMQAPTVSPSVADSAIQPDAPALESGSRPPAVSTLRREPHPFLTKENAKAYAQDPRMEGLTIDIDYEYPSEIQHLPWNVFLTPRERGASLQDEYLAAHYAAKQLRDGELIRRVCDDWNYNSANSYTPNDLRHGPITVWPQGRVTPAMRASYGDCARFWSKQVRLVADVPMEFRSFDDDAAAKITEWK